METLVGRLMDTVERPVIDKTGFTSLFDLELDFATDLIAAPLNSDGTPQASDPAGLPSIFVALKQQLGLKLERSKAPVEVIVIDRLERPSAD
jgi:uncharacterized protein (TIGR03435 family)